MMLNQLLYHYSLFSLESYLKLKRVAPKDHILMNSHWYFTEPFNISSNI